MRVIPARILKTCQAWRLRLVVLLYIFAWRTGGRLPSRREYRAWSGERPTRDGVTCHMRFFSIPAAGARSRKIFQAPPTLSSQTSRACQSQAPPSSCRAKTSFSASRAELLSVHVSMCSFRVSAILGCRCACATSRLCSRWGQGCGPWPALERRKSSDFRGAHWPFLPHVSPRLHQYSRRLQNRAMLPRNRARWRLLRVLLVCA